MASLVLLLIAFFSTRAISDVAEASSHPVLSTSDVTASVGETVSVPVILSQAPTGLSGFDLNVTLANDKVARITNVQFPNFGLTQSSLISGSQVRLQVVDLNSLVQVGASNVTLATLDIETITGGTSDIQVSVTIMDDDAGNPVQPGTLPGSLSVQSTYGLTASPDAVALGGTVTVDWTAPAGSAQFDWIGLHQVGDPNNVILWWMHTGGAAAGQAQVQMPREEGDYEFRYFINNSLIDMQAVSNTVSTQFPHTLTANPATLMPGDTVTVDWTAPSVSAQFDWIGLHRVGDPNNVILWWMHTGGAAAGQAQVQMPGGEGDYEFRYFINNSLIDKRATSNTVTVTVPHSLTASPAQVMPGDTVTVNWTAATSSAQFDWIGLHRVGDPNNAILWWMHTGGAAAGQAQVQMPREEGDYEFRYFINNSLIDKRATSNTVAVKNPYGLTVSPDTAKPGDTVTVNWTAATGSAQFDWIGLHRVGDPNNAILWWMHTGGAATGQVQVQMPGEEGDYEFRYFINNSLIDKRATSNTVTVTVPHSVTASPAQVMPGDAVTLDWTAPAGSAVFDWIGLHRVGDPNKFILWWMHTGGAATGQAQVQMPREEGNYEFRYFINNSLIDKRATSNTVTVNDPNRLPALTATGAEVNAGESLAIPIVLSKAPTAGVAGFDIYVTLTNPKIARITSVVLPDYGLTDEILISASELRLRAVDLNSVIGNDAINFTAATVNIQTVVGGTSDIEISVVRMDDEAGDPVQLDVVPGILIVQSPHSLTTASGTVRPGDTVTVDWAAPVGSPQFDWIGLHRVGDPNNVILWWMHTGGAESGQAPVKMPREEGDYEFRYFINNSLIDMRAISSTVTVQNPYSLVASPATVAPGDTVTVDWTSPAGSPQFDWIGLHRVGDPNNVILWWMHTGGAAAGQAQVQMPREEGDYEFRYFINNSLIDKQATSNTVTVGN